MIYNSCLIPIILSAQKNGHHLRNSHSFRSKKWPSLTQQPLLPSKKNGRHLGNSHSFRPKKMAVTYATATPSVQKKWPSLTQKTFLPLKKNWPSLTHHPFFPRKKMAITYAPAIPFAQKNGYHLRDSHSFRAKKWPSLSRQPLLPLKKNGRHFRDSHFLSILLILIRVVISRFLTFYPIPTLLLLLQLMIC
jgi:hypothetical protein